MTLRVALGVLFVGIVLVLLIGCGGPGAKLQNLVDITMQAP